MKVRALESIVPSVHIPQETWDDMMHITAIVNKEVGWFTRVLRAENEFTLYEVHLPRQQSSGTTVEFEPDHLYDYLMELKEVDPANFGDLNRTLRGWGHSHVNMGVGPSVQDQRTIEKLVQNLDYFVAVRVNKRGEVEADVVLASTGMVYEDVKVTVGEVDSDRRAHWQKLVDDRVKPMPVQSYTYTSKGKGKDAAIVAHKSYYGGYNTQFWDERQEFNKQVEKAMNEGMGADPQPTNFLGLSDETGDRISRGWWDAMADLWPELSDLYFSDRQFVSEDEALLPLLAITEKALMGQDAETALRLMVEHDVDLLELIDAGWQPMRGWRQTLSAYADAEKAEQAKLEVLDS